MTIKAKVRSRRFVSMNFVMSVFFIRVMTMRLPSILNSEQLNNPSQSPLASLKSYLLWPKRVSSMLSINWYILEPCFPF